MRQRIKVSVILRSATALIAVLVLLVLAFSPSARAETSPQPPWKGCYAVDKREYADKRSSRSALKPAGLSLVELIVFYSTAA